MVDEQQQRDPGPIDDMVRTWFWEIEPEVRRKQELKRLHEQGLNLQSAADLDEEMVLSRLYRF